MSLQEKLRKMLARRKADELYRLRQVLDSPQGVEVMVDGRRHVNFSSNDYLGLARHPEVMRALCAGAEQWGVGSGAAHLVTGHLAPHHALEEELAEFTGRPRALLFSTGYMANLGVVSALVGRGDTVFGDRLNHASLVDATVLSRAKSQRYRHADVDHLEELLGRASGGEKLIVTDGVFSMDGDLAPLPQLADTARRHGAGLLVDDAHGLGVLGRRGRGSLEHFDHDAGGLDAGRVPVLMGTLGKALGTFGAFVAGSEDLVEYLIQQARSYIYTTALPPAVAEATRASLRLVRTEGWRREQLATLVRRFRAGAEQLGLGLLESATPIQPLLLGDSGAALRVSRRLREAGYLVGAIRPPTVPRGTARLRITLCAEHTEAQVDGLLDALAGCGVGA